ncbi:MAG: sortase [Chloroflexi bacterium]|nr:sortase [Chloroflexota bacterium]
MPSQSADYRYTAQSELWIEIPRLEVRLDIVGIPIAETKDWDLTWLGDQAGWLEGTAFPTQAGNSALTAHTYLPSGDEGPFVNLGSLRYGDSIIVHYAGQRYIYEVRENRVVRPDSIGYALRHQDYPWLTLITCRTYSEATEDYVYRVVIQAIQVRVE